MCACNEHQEEYFLVNSQHTLLHPHFAASADTHDADSSDDDSSDEEAEAIQKVCGLTRVDVYGSGAWMSECACVRVHAGLKMQECRKKCLQE